MPQEFHPGPGVVGLSAFLARRLRGGAVARPRLAPPGVASYIEADLRRHSSVLCQPPDSGRRDGQRENWTRPGPNGPLEPMSTKGLTGSLKTMSLPDLLQWAGSGRKTGTLSLKSGPLHKKIYFQHGAIIGSSSNDTREYLGQFMLSEGIITEQQLKDAFDLQAQTKVMLGRILVKKGLVSEAKVSEILRVKAEETIYSLFLWSESDFAFLENELPPGDQVLISIKVEDVLMEGLRRYDTSKNIRQALPHNGVVLKKTAKPLPPDIASKVFPKRIYDMVDGHRVLADVILEAHASEFSVCQVLYVMAQKGYLEVG